MNISQAKPDPTIVVMGPQRATTKDLSIKCHFAECNFIGDDHCTWDNHCCRGGDKGGCGRRFCTDHSYSQLLVSRDDKGNIMGAETVSACVACSKALEQDIKANIKTAGWIKCACGLLPCVIIAIVMLSIMT